MFDYSSITVEKIEEMANEAIANAEKLRDEVASASEPLSFDEVLAPLDQITNLVRIASGRTEFLKHVHVDEKIRDAATAAGQRLKAWDQFPAVPRSMEVAFDPRIYDVVVRYAATEDAAGLTGERRRLLDFVLIDLKMVGHHLSEKDRGSLKEMSDRLVELGSSFGRNIAEYDDYLLIGDDETEGLPEAFVDSLERDGETGKLKVGLTNPEVVPFMANAARRDLREQLSFKWNTRAVEENRPLLEEAVALRLRMARLLGFESWADRVVSTRMAKTKDQVEAMYEGLLPRVAEKGREEITRVSELLEDDTGDGEVRTWDWSYYDTRIRKTEYGIDPEEVAEYFPMEEVLDGMFELTGEVFGVGYRQIEAPVWHEDVLVYEVVDREFGDLIGTFYLDLYPRKGKYTHFMVVPLVPGKQLSDGRYQEPVAAMLCNFTKPTESAPSLLKHNEVETLFHEFGHILHDLMGHAEFARFAGAYTEWDFVEAPSQIMEHWIWRPEVLQRFAHHHQTGEPIPTAMVEALVEARLLNQGMFYLRQMSLGMFDQGVHGPEETKDLEEILRETASVTMLPFHEGTFQPASFGHILSGGYDAAYYGYLWSEMFGDDMFSRFEEEGVTNPEVGRDYRNLVIGKGGTVDAIEMLRDFLGREPNNQAFLRKAGIT
ncbi:MAG: M3 family metallopeptidase [Acidimicrobiia bacterium]|nr:M3 family metallopeptidase [Acidimicrobiia bacterium]